MLNAVWPYQQKMTPNFESPVYLIRKRKHTKSESPSPLSWQISETGKQLLKGYVMTHLFDWTVLYCKTPHCHLCMCCKIKSKCLQICKTISEFQNKDFENITEFLSSFSKASWEDALKYSIKYGVVSVYSMWKKTRVAFLGSGEFLDNRCILINYLLFYLLHQQIAKLLLEFMIYILKQCLYIVYHSVIQ